MLIQTQTHMEHLLDALQNQKHLLTNVYHDNFLKLFYF